jgi:hypothetical protein
MKRFVAIIASVLSLLTLHSCSKSNSFIHCTNWIGDYAFHEDPIPTATGINKIMEWELSVSQQRDTCWGMLEVTGLTTYMKLLTTISGDSSKVDVVYYKYLDGTTQFKPGDVLFSLSKEDSSKILTSWSSLQPMLAEFPEAEGACFKRLKKRKTDEL